MPPWEMCVGDVCAWLLSEYLWKTVMFRGYPFDNKNLC